MIEEKMFAAMVEYAARRRARPVFWVRLATGQTYSGDVVANGEGWVVLFITDEDSKLSPRPESPCCYRYISEAHVVEAELQLLGGDTEEYEEVESEGDRGGAAISSAEILKATNIGSPKTLTRWHQRGLIPPPEVRTHPSGRGKMAYWPGWVVWRIRKVKARLDQGRGLDEIAKELGTDWAAEERRWAEGGDAEAEQDLFNETAADFYRGFVNYINSDEAELPDCSRFGDMLKQFGLLKEQPE